MCKESAATLSEVDRMFLKSVSMNKYIAILNYLPLASLYSFSQLFSDSVSMETSLAPSAAQDAIASVQVLILDVWNL